MFYILKVQWTNTFSIKFLIINILPCAYLSGLDSPTMTPCPPVQGASPSQCDSEQLEDRGAVSDKLQVVAQVSARIFICPVGFYFLHIIKRKVKIKALTMNPLNQSFVLCLPHLYERN